MAQRTKLAECLSFLRDDDVLTVTKPDRLARSTAELLAIEADLSKRGIGLVVLSMGGERLDTRTVQMAGSRYGGCGDSRRSSMRAVADLAERVQGQVVGLGEGVQVLFRGGDGAVA